MERRDLRHKMLEKRKTLKPETVEMASLKVCAILKDLNCFKEARKIASYVAINGEINPKSLESSEKVFSFPLMQESGNLKFFRSNGNFTIVVSLKQNHRSHGLPGSSGTSFAALCAQRFS